MKRAHLRAPSLLLLLAACRPCTGGSPPPVDSGPAAPPPPVTSCENDRCEPGETVDSCPYDCQPPGLPQRQPNFAIEWHSATQASTLTKYVIPSTPPPWTFNDRHLSATVTADGEGVYTVRITGGPGAAEIDKVLVPWLEYSDALPHASADRAYYTYLGGMTASSTSASTYSAAHGLDYPGTAFTPMVILADDRTARLTGATTWPPRKVKVARDLAVTQGVYREPLRPGDTQTYGVMLLDLEGRPDSGYPPWLLALEKYRRWFLGKYQPPRAPAWMERGDGFLLYPLQDAQPDDVTALDGYWTTWGARLGWVQFWGQMSGHYGLCCDVRMAMDGRLTAWLPAWAAQKTAAGAHVGYYARAVEPVVEAQLTAWFDHNRNNYSANTYYADVLGRTPHADPWAISQAFQRWPKDILIEGFVDVYGAPSLFTGYVDGGAWKGGAEVSTDTCRTCPFVRLSRYFQGDRLAYYGPSNGEHVHFGPSAAYFAERQTHLLGFKLEFSPTSHSPVLQRVIDLRDQTQWWTRSPRYLDVLGITDVPDGVDARRFVDNAGKTIVAIDNPARLDGRQLKVNGRSVGIPADALSIVEVP